MGRKLSEETKEKIRLKALGHKRGVGRKLSEDHKQKISLAHRGMKHGEAALAKIRALAAQRRGKPLPAEQLAKMRASKSEVLTCPHCDKTGKAGGMQKNHFEHCKVLRQKNEAPSGMVCLAVA